MVKGHLVSAILVLVVLMAGNRTGLAQKQITPSASISVSGAVKNASLIKPEEIMLMKDSLYGDAVIMNHKGEVRDTLKQLRGVPLIRFLKSTQFDYSQPRELNGFYFVLKATDGYATVISWNELYNSPLGKSFCIITRLGEVPLPEMKNRIAFISHSDGQGGKRYIKALSSIEVRRIADQ